MAAPSFPITSMDTIQQCIPQRPPMVMVDCLLHYTDNSVIATLTVVDTNLFVQDDKFQEAGIIEHMAQSVALHTGYGYLIKDEQAPVGYIGSISNLNIYKLPAIGNTIQTEVRIIQEFAGVTLVDVASMVDGEIIVQGQMKTVLAK